MKQYPSIPYWSSDLLGESCIAFDKLDGSNIRCEWSRKRGWYKFGTRTQMIDERNENFGDAIPLFLDKYGDDLGRVFHDRQYKSKPNYVAFFEYLGPNSFAGQHSITDKKDVVLLDISEYKRGLIPPKEFVQNFGHLHIPNIIYQGYLNQQFIDDIKNGQYPVDEGVMCKGTRKTKGSELIWIAKVKTKSWVDKVKAKYGAEWTRKELNGDKNLIDYFNI
jgi:hypothetical protein